MSKLVNMYLNLKEKDNSTLYLFKSGIFYIFIDEDAKIMSNYLNLKLTQLNSKYLKCGFPENAFEKYINKINNSKYNICIINISKNTSYEISEYKNNNSIETLLKTISQIDSDSLSIKEAYNFISKIKEQSINILKGENNIE